jgi:hypothetical protein
MGKVKKVDVSILIDRKREEKIKVNKVKVNYNTKCTTNQQNRNDSFYLIILIDDAREYYRKV